MAVDDRDEDQQEAAPNVPSQRLCGNKTCNRVLIPGVSGPLCQKCRMKMKKRQTMTKQRFKLEPKKITVAKSAVSH